MAKDKDINQNTEQNIIEVATDLFAQKGFEGASTREICKLAGANISLISYYFGGKKELYDKVVNNITDKIILYMKSRMGVQELPTTFDNLPKAKRVEMLLDAIDFVIDYFYSERISDSEMMIFFKEQIMSDDSLNVMGYSVFRKLMASILGKGENDKEVVLRCITIIGSIHSARIFKQFSVRVMGQSGYSKEDIQMLKQIIIGQVKSILKSLGALGEE